MPKGNKKNYQFEISRNCKQTAVVKIKDNDRFDAAFEFMKLAADKDWRKSLNWGNSVIDENADFKIVSREGSGEPLCIRGDMSIELSHEELQHVASSRADYIDNMDFFRFIKPGSSSYAWWVDVFNDGVKNGKLEHSHSLKKKISELNDQIGYLKEQTEWVGPSLEFYDGEQFDSSIIDIIDEIYQSKDEADAVLRLASTIYAICKYHPEELKTLELEQV